MEFITNRSPATRWILVPIVFVASSSIVHGLVITASLVLSIFWRLDEANPGDTETNLWFYRTIVANALSAYCAAYFSGWTAPKYQVATTCVGAAVYLLINLFLIFGMFTSEGWWEFDDLIIILSTTGGAILAIYMAKEHFFE